MAWISGKETALQRIQEAYQSKTTSLNLSTCSLEKLPPEIFGLEWLEELDLSYNSLNNLASISNLKSLQKLNLTFNALTVSTIPDEISQLEELIYLDLSRNYLKTIPHGVCQIPKLETLIINAAKMQYLTADICYLKKLKHLELGDTHDSQGDPWGGNNITELPPEIGELTNLVYLNLLSNKIENLPPEIGNLSNLKTLILGHDWYSSNRLVSLPREIGKLSNLEILDLTNNRINKLPKELNRLSNLKTIVLRGNPINLPPEIHIESQEADSILDYYFSVYEDVAGNEVVVRKGKPLNQLKLLFVGQGSVGKTSIVSRITDGLFDDKRTKTEGISISDWQLECKDVTSEDKNDDSQIKLNIWDFGGQEIMHTTHQFFLTKRSLYLLVLDANLTQEANGTEYWLKLIQSFGHESPVLIIGNKVDQHPLDIGRTDLQKKYPNIVSILETSAATGAGIEELKAAITEQVNNIPHVRDLLPETWFTIKTKMEELGKQSNFITYDKYLELCVENEVSDETSQRRLIDFLHDLGVVLHFQDDPRLEALGILNPQWVTNGVYKILNSHTLFQNKGVLTVSMLDEILNLPEYPRGKRLFIVDMMKKFELCYDIEPDKTFLVPDLLPKDQPDLNFNGIPAFEYAYPVLPSSVITRFIVRMNQHICDGGVWRTGVLLKIGENTALVKADIEDRKITITIDGLEHTRRDALSAIRYELGEIHNSIKGLNPQQRVPVPNAPMAEPLKYDYLLKLERSEQEFLPVENGNDLVTVNVRQMLSAIESEAQRREQHGNVINNYYNASDGGIIVGRDLSGNLISGNNNKINSAEIGPELKDTLLQLAEAVEAMIQELPAEQATEVAEDFGKLADEAVKPKPNKRWYSVSIDGLIKAAENLEKVGEPVINLSRKALSLLTGGMLK